LNILVEKEHFIFYQDFLYKSECSFLKEKLKDIPWRQVRYNKQGRGEIVTPRETWVSGGFTFVKNPHPPWILPLLNLMQTYFNTDFNYILYSKYCSPTHSISPHSDDEFFLGHQPKIAILNIGDSINFNLINKISKDKDLCHFTNGDVILLQNNCQQDYFHSIKKDKKFIGKTRYSMSFRKVIHPYGDSNYNKYN
jgi:alkylated DNA repair dioxygenase AlkB